MSNPYDYGFTDIVSAGWKLDDPRVEVSIVWTSKGKETTIVSGCDPKRVFGPAPQGERALTDLIEKKLARSRIFSFAARALATPVPTRRNPELGQDGSNLSAVLNALSGSEPERFDMLNKELQRWLPEFDESPADEAAIKILVDSISGSESELFSFRTRPNGWTRIFDLLSNIIKHLHYGTVVDALVVVVDSDESPVHASGHDDANAENLDCRLCRLRQC